MNETINIITQGIHHKVKKNLIKGFDLCKIKYVLDEPIDKTDYIYSPGTYFNPKNYPKKRFIFGPSFDFSKTYDFENIKNAVYIQPSQQSINIRKALGFKKLEYISFPVGVDTYDFKPDNNIKTEVFLYIKGRNPKDIEKIVNFLKEKNINYHKFVYGNYKEQDYKKFLISSKYGIWVGKQESQGLALQEALSCNVPLLIWDVSKRGDEYPLSVDKIKVKDMQSTSAPYWDNTCGEKFTNFDDIGNVFEKFTKNLQKYKPRDFILKNLTLEKQSLTFLNIFRYIKPYRCFYVIWNHGLKYLEEILKMMQNRGCVISKTFMVKTDIEKFINVLYTNDNAPIQHIKAKTKHLLSMENKFFIIFFRAENKNIPYELKWEIRKLFNPRFPDPKTHPHPALPPGVTHEHVIHSPDTEEEVFFMEDIIENMK